MYIVYSPVQNKLGIWQDGWAYVALKRPVMVVGRGRQIATVYVESIAEFGSDWEIITEL